MRVRRLLVGLTTVGMAVTGLSTAAFAADAPKAPALPYIEIPREVRPAFNLLSPVGAPMCQVGYLAPSFLSPLFSPFNTICVLTPLPKYRTCGPDPQIHQALRRLPEPPAVGGRTVDVFADVPAPFASVVGTIAAVQFDIENYVPNGAPPPDITTPLVDQIGCSAT